MWVNEICKHGVRIAPSTGPPGAASVAVSGIFERAAAVVMERAGSWEAFPTAILSGGLEVGSLPASRRLSALFVIVAFAVRSQETGRMRIAC